MRDFVSSQRFERTGTRATHGDRDAFGRPDAIDFTGRAGERLVDWLAEAFVWIDRWPSRHGVATLFELLEGEWSPLASAMPFDGIHVRLEQEVHVAFSQYVPLTAGAAYRLYLPDAIVTRDTLRIGAIQRHPDHQVLGSVRRTQSREAVASVRSPKPRPAGSTPATAATSEHAPAAAGRLW